MEDKMKTIPLTCDLLNNLEIDYLTISCNQTEEDSTQILIDELSKLYPGLNFLDLCELRKKSKLGACSETEQELLAFGPLFPDGLELKHKLKSKPYDVFFFFTLWSRKKS